MRRLRRRCRLGGSMLRDPSFVFGFLCCDQRWEVIGDHNIDIEALSGLLISSFPIALSS